MQELPVHHRRLHEAVERLLTPESLRHICGAEAESLLPAQAEVNKIIDLCRAILFPGYFGDTEFNSLNLPYFTGIKAERLWRVTRRQVEAALHMAGDTADYAERAADITSRFISGLPELRDALVADAEAIYLGDPAALSVGEVIYSYPAIRAVADYRVAHALHLLGVPVIPRMICEHAHRETGIDIHPAASIGRSFMIDHGTGVVIGETAIIGDNVKIYQGVTLGARSFPSDEEGNPVKGLPRHPVIGDGVVIYANSTILGRVHIGAGAVVGGNIWITEDVAPGSIVMQARANYNIRQKPLSQEDER